MPATFDVTIRSYLPDDLGQIAALWNRCLPKDSLSEERFWRLFVLDPNFTAEGALVATTATGEIVGFLQAMARRVPLGSLGTQPEIGWLTTFFVHPKYRRQGIGSRLLETGLNYLAQQGRKTVHCNGYAPYYLFPGVAVEYSDAHAFLEARGFTRFAEPVAMGMALENVTTPDAVREQESRLAAEGIALSEFERRDTLPLLAFAEEYFPHWQPGVLESLQQGNTGVLLARQGDAILAFAQWENNHTDPPHGAPGRFGPFGVRPDLRSHGIGAIVFYRLIERVKERGGRYLWFGWAGGRNLSFYERAGCVVTRRFVQYQKRIGSATNTEP